MMHPASIAAELAAPSLRRYPLFVLDELRKRFTVLRADPDHARVLTGEMIVAEVERRRALRGTWRVRKPRSKKPKPNRRRARTTKEVARLEEFLRRADATRQERPLTDQEEVHVAEAGRDARRDSEPHPAFVPWRQEGQ